MSDAHADDSTDAEPQTLAEMQRMTTQDFSDVDRYHYQGDLSVKRVVRHLVELAADELTWQGRDDAGSLRDFWYNPVKAVLEAAFPNWGDGAGTSNWNRNMTKRLSAVVSEKVKDGELTYRDLNILDDSRDRRIATDSLEHDKILFVEKSAAYRKLKPLAEVYDLTLVEGSGWQATALIEDLGQQLEPDTRYTFYVLGDFDPTGFGIVEDFVDRAAQLGITVDRENSRRIGIRPDQVSDDVLENQKFTPASNGSDDDWFDQYAIDGEYGLEIEAVGASLEGKADALRELVVDEIQDDMDVDGRRFQDVHRQTKEIPYRAARSVVRSITSDLEDALEAAACDQMEDQDGVQSCEPSAIYADLDLDRDAVLNGQTGPAVPDAYDREDLHRGAVDGSPPRVGNHSGIRTVKRGLRDQIQQGDIDVADLLSQDD